MISLPLVCTSFHLCAFPLAHYLPHMHFSTSCIFFIMYMLPLLHTLCLPHMLYLSCALPLPCLHFASCVYTLPFSLSCMHICFLPLSLTSQSLVLMHYLMHKSFASCEHDLPLSLSDTHFAALPYTLCCCCVSLGTLLSHFLLLPFLTFCPVLSRISISQFFALTCTAFQSLSVPLCCTHYPTLPCHKSLTATNLSPPHPSQSPPQPLCMFHLTPHLSLLAPHRCLSHNLKHTFPLSDVLCL